jgi:type II secretory pathway pseudopilin PulG
MTRTTNRKRRRGPTAGYTLTELLVIVAMLGIILLVSIPELAKWGQKMQIDGAVRTTAMHIAAARLKAVANGFDHQVTIVPPTTGYTNLRGTSIAQFSGNRTAVVIEGDEGTTGNTDDNGNGIPSEHMDPLPGGTPDRTLVQMLPYNVTITSAPPLPLDPGYTFSVFPPPTLVFRKNGVADLDDTSSALVILYLTNGTDF